MILSAYVQSAREVGEAKSFEGRLAAAWPRFVDCEARLSSLGPFLVREVGLASGMQVLDAAAGIGCDALFVASLGCQTTANELSCDFRKLIRARKSSELVTLTRHDWRDMVAAFGPTKFDAVLMLGNSLALILDDFTRDRIVAQAYEVCRKGGVFLVDQRNFERIYAEQAAIKEGRFEFGNKVMYCGDEVIAHPLSISRASINMGYFEGRTSKVIGRLDMATLLRGWLPNALRRAGFVLEAHHDLGLSRHEEADFVTYVARKPA